MITATELLWMRYHRATRAWQRRHNKHGQVLQRGRGPDAVLVCSCGQQRQRTPIVDPA